MYNYVLECDDGEIRLVGGTSNSEGTVEICFGSLWGLITESGWTDDDASVVCKQLGFLGEGILSQFINIIIIYKVIQLLMWLQLQVLWDSEAHSLVSQAKPFKPVMSHVLEMRKHSQIAL